MGQSPSLACRAGAIAVTIAIALVGFSASAPAGPDDQQAVTGACDSKRYTMLFWPDGHPEIPEFAFPEFLVPHIEIYTTKTLTEDDFVAYVGADGSNNVAPTCTDTATVTLSKPKSAKTEDGTSAIVCKFEKPAKLQIAPGDGSDAPRISLFQSGKVVGATATISESDAEVAYNKKLCKVRAAPPDGP